MKPKRPGSEVIEVNFRPTVADPADLALRVKRRSLSDCSHARATINLALRTVTCNECNTDLDPIERLAVIARDWERVAITAKQREYVRKTLLEEIAEIKRERTNLKAQIRRASR